MAPDGDPITTWIGSSTSDSITVGGRDLASELMGSVSLTELTDLLVTRRDPTPGQRRLLDAVLVSLADHGLTPSALAGSFHGTPRRYRARGSVPRPSYTITARVREGLPSAWATARQSGR